MALKASKASPNSTLAITDHDNLSGIVHHYRACKFNQVKPIYGMEITTADGHHLTLLAKNQMGLTNLFRLSALDKSYDDLSRHRTGLVCMSGDLMGAIPLSILRQDREELNRHLGILQDIYRKDFYLEVIDHGFEEQRYIKEIYDKISITKVATNDVHYLNEEDAELHSVLLCDKLKRYANIENLTYHIPTKAYLNDIPEDFGQREINEKCNVNLRLGDIELPHFELPSDYSDEYSYLRDLTYNGLKAVCPNASGEYYDRLEYELEVIRTMGFSGYFLIVWDFVDFAHRQGIPVGPGRGSGAGSLVAYCLRITDLDPIKYKLLFERFLNPERVSMPDFDIDFSMSRREEVIRYVVDKYGERSVCQIATFSELKPRSSWKVAARALGVSHGDSDAFSKLLPEPPKQTEQLSDIFDRGYVKKTADEMYQKIESPLRDNPKWRKIVDIATKLEGSYRNVGRGAAGVLISNGPLTDYIPAWDAEGKDFPIQVKDNAQNLTRYLSQVDKTESEKMGLVKFDFLGLAELDVIEYTLHLIDMQGKEVPDLNLIPLDDPKVFELISTGRTLGMFQVSSEGMSQMMARMNASSFEDIVAAVALYRPGPMDAGMDDVYIRRKNGEEPIEYLHPDLEPVLNTTYGVIVYQEQVMEIAQVICGYTLGGADLLRRAMGKKKPEEMAAQQDTFMSGGRKNGYSEELLDELWRQIETFARYGFNRSHAACYAMITYRTAWLKAHYTAELLAAQMQIRRDNFDEVTMFINDAHSFGIKTIEPDIHISPLNFRVNEGNVIMIGTGGLKNISVSVAREMEQCLGIDSLTELFYEVNVDLSSLTSLTYSGALDRYLGPDTYQARADFLEQYKKFKQFVRNNPPNQMRMFKDLEPTVEEGVAEPPDKRFMLDMERKYLGRYRTGHPVDEFREKANELKVTRIDSLSTREGDVQMICAVVTDVSEKTTKNNDLMAFFRLEDETGTIDACVFPDLYDPSIHLELEEKVVFVVLEVSYYKGKPSPIAIEIKDALN